MLPKLVSISRFSVSGIAARTINSDEFDPLRARLPALWGDFFANGVSGKIVNKMPDSPVYGVYSAYESDASGHYTVTAGVATEGVADGVHASVDVVAGRYLVFERRGPMPKAVIDAWVAVWTFFQNNTEYVRSYASDFEEYRGPDEVAIYIGVKD